MNRGFHRNILWGRVLIVISLLVIFWAHPNFNAAAQTTESLSVTFLDAGQGDSSVISTSNGFDILIDAGPESAGEAVVAFLTNYGIDSLEVIVISHNHEDHLGGLVDVLQSSISVLNIYYNGSSCTTQICAHVWTEMGNRGITPIALTNGDTFNWDTVDANILNPRTSQTGDANEDSVVMDLTFFDDEILYTGDIGFDTENDLLNQSLLHPIDILKVAHHGSAYSTSTAFLTTTFPVNSVISVGADNAYGHPNSETLTRLSNAGTTIYRTDLDGDVSFTLYKTEPQAAAFTYLPLIMNGGGSNPTPPAEPINPPDAMPSENVQCNTYGNAEICASVSDPNPSQYSYVTVYGRSVINGSAQGGRPMYTTWHYKTTTPTCSGNVTHSGGVASCERYISDADVGYQVNINVTIDGFSVKTAFTPISN
jgi:competence protein ComEC